MAKIVLIFEDDSEGGVEISLTAKTEDDDKLPTDAQKYAAKCLELLEDFLEEAEEGAFEHLEVPHGILLN